MGLQKFLNWSTDVAVFSHKTKKINLHVFDEAIEITPVTKVAFFLYINVQVIVSEKWENF